MTNRLLYLLLSLLLAITACKDSEPDDNTPSTSLNKIMPLGASRVEGARPGYESFRYELWKLLVDGAWDFDYIGTMDDPAEYPSYANMDFDDDHEGRGGWTSGEILGGIDEWLAEAGAPDIVLFSSPGGNDALTGLPYEDAIANINAIIDIIQTANPNVSIIIEQLAPARSDAMTPELTTFFTQMNQDVLTIASQQTTATSSVTTVDMATGFDDSFYADDVHYNEAGATVVANRYYEILVDILKQ